MRGFLKQVVLLASLLLGIFLAVRFSEATAGVLAHFVPWSPYVVLLVAFLCNFILAIILVYIVSHLVRSILQQLSIVWLDKLLGLVLGFCTMLFLMSSFFFVFAHLPSSSPIISPAVQAQSRFYRPVASVAPAVYPRLRAMAHQAWERVQVSELSSAR